jgi:hypothetical protein
VSLKIQDADGWTTLMWDVFSIIGHHTQTERLSESGGFIGLSKQAIATELPKKLKDKSPKAIQALIEAEVIVTIYDDMNHKHYALNWYELERNAHRNDVAPIIERANIILS